MKFILRKSEADSPFSFVFMGENDKVLLKSESYKQKSSALNGIESVKKNCTDDKRYEMKTAKSGKLFFNLKSSNGQVVGTSGFFDSESELKKGIEYLKKHCVKAKTEE